MSINTIQELIRQEMRERRYTRVVIDSLTSLRYFYIKTSEENASLISFFRLLSDLGVTSLLTVQLAEVSKPDVEAHMARGEVMLHKWFNGRGLMRGITIEKFRGSSHDQRLRNMRMSDTGMEIKLTPQEKAELKHTAAGAEEAEDTEETEGGLERPAPGPPSGHPDEGTSHDVPPPPPDLQNEAPTSEPPPPDGGGGI